jgi:hypothetical protein
MRRFAIFVTSLLLIASAACLFTAAESDGAAAEGEIALLYDVYKVDVTAKSLTAGNCEHIVYYLRSDTASQDLFETALANREALPPSDPSIDVLFGDTVHELTVYALCTPQYGYYSGYKYLEYLGDWSWTSKSIDKTALLEGVSTFHLPFDVKADVTVGDLPGSPSLKLVQGYSHYHYYDFEANLEKGSNKISVIEAGEYLVISSDWNYTSPYASYTVEYECPPDASSQGYVLLAVGVLLLGLMVWFGLPRRIGD